MKPQAGAFLEKAHALLRQADVMLEVRLTDAAGRTAYLAGVHAAQALIFERTGKVARRHRGVQGQLHMLTKDEPDFDIELRAFLGRTYNLKAIADYETGPGSEISVAQAEQAVREAERFIACIETLLA
ncbi:MAG TPA: HEPN domain-containing protein [Stellaceae bacterium]|jgi:uncharacterized protein (UPF0332 family)|nr:HEPN domain-containing protein [Stellaceae bacterium]